MTPDLERSFLGYSVFWNVFNTSVHTDIPQNRERTFIIGFKDEVDWDFNPNKKTSSAKFNSYLPLAVSKTKKKFREMLENGEVELEESINLFEKGMKLKKVCEEKLKSIELQIKKIKMQNQ